MYIWKGMVAIAASAIRDEIQGDPVTGGECVEVIGKVS